MNHSEFMGESKLSHFSKINIFVLITFLALAGLIVFQLVMEFFNARYDWDIDHEMYYGQALLRGELLWTKEFHDKLPVVQYLFAIPAALETVTAWRVVSVIFASLFVALLYRNSAALFGSSGFNTQNARRVSLIGSALFIFFIAFLPGGITHINVVAASSAGSAIICFFLLFREAREHLGVVGVVLAGAFFTTIAISVRPYFLPSLVVVWILLFIHFFRSNHFYRVPQKTAIGLASSVAIVAFGFGGNLIPYLVVGKLEAFREGLGLLLSGLNPRPPASAFMSYAQSGLSQALISVWFLGMLVLSLVLVYQSFSRLDAWHELSNLVAVAGLVLALTILTQHWWPHYTTLFSTFFAVVAATSIAKAFSGSSLLSKGSGAESQLGLLTRGNKVKLSVALSIAAVITGLVGPLLQDFQNRSTEHRSENRLLTVASLLPSDAESRPSFLDPSNMYVHWKLEEPRHGFPHAANTGHIHSGWWDSVAPASNFRVAHSTQDYCRMLLESDIEVVFADHDSALGLCFSGAGPDSEYSLVSEAEIEGGLIQMWGQ